MISVLFIDDYSTPLLSGQNKPSAVEQPVRRGMQLGARGGQNKTEMDKLADMLRNEVPSAIPDATLADSSVAAATSAVVMQKWVFCCQQLHTLTRPFYLLSFVNIEHI